MPFKQSVRKPYTPWDGPIVVLRYNIVLLSTVKMSKRPIGYRAMIGYGRADIGPLRASYGPVGHTYNYAYILLLYVYFASKRGRLYGSLDCRNARARYSIARSLSRVLTLANCKCDSANFGLDSNIFEKYSIGESKHTHLEATS